MNISSAGRREARPWAQDVVHWLGRTDSEQVDQSRTTALCRDHEGSRLSSWTNSAPKGRTPAASMYASMILTARFDGRKSNGEIAPICTDPVRGMFGLTAWLPDEVARADRGDAIGRSGKGLLDRARSAPPCGLREPCWTAARRDGIRQTSKVTRPLLETAESTFGERFGSRRFAIRIRMAVQAKRWKSNVLAPVVQQVRGSLGAHEQGLIITTSDFSSGAKKEAQRSDAAPVALIGGEQLAALLAEHEIGARMTSYDLYTLDEADSAEA